MRAQGLAVLALAVVCLLAPAVALAADGMTVQDMAGRSGRVPKNVSRIIALGPGALRLVVYLGVFDRVVGVEEAEKGRFPLAARPYGLAVRERIMTLPSVGEGGAGRNPDPERILVLKPDLIVAVGVDTAQVSGLEAKTGVPVLVLDYGEIGVFREEALRSLELLGRVTGREKRATDILRFIHACREDLQRRTAGIGSKEKPRAYVGGIGHKGRHGLMSTEAGFLPLAYAGGRNVADEAGRPGHLLVDREQLLAWRPDVIFIDTNGLDLVSADYAANPAFYDALGAVKQGRVYSLFPYNFYGTNVEIALADAYFIGKILYPGLFRDIDPGKKAREIVRFFVGQPVFGEMKEAYRGFGTVSFEKGRIDVR
jgi:iron complex transport system substrate-binding protein